MGPGCSNLIRSPYRFARIPQNTSPAFFVFITFITFIAKSRNIRKIWNTCWKLDRRFWTLTCFCASSTVLLFSLHLLIHALRLVLQLLSCQVVQQNMSSLGKKHSSWRIPFSTTPCSVAGNAMRILWNHLLSQNCACPTWVEIAKWELIFHTYQVRCIFEYSYAAWNEIVPDFRRNKSIFGISDAITKVFRSKWESPKTEQISLKPVARSGSLLVQLFFLLLKPFCHILCLVFQSLVQSVLGILGFWRRESFKNGRFGGCFFGGTNTTTETYSLMMFFLVGCGYKNKIGSWSLSKSTYMKLKLLDWQWDWDRNWLKKTLQSS